MKIQAKYYNPFEQLTDTLVLAIAESSQTNKTNNSTANSATYAAFSPLLKTADELTNGFFSKQQQQGHFPTSAGDIRTFYDVAGISAKSVTVIAYKNTCQGYVAANKKLITHFKSQQYNSAVITSILETITNIDLTQTSKFAAQAMYDADYICDQYKSKKSDKKPLDIEFAAIDESQLNAINSGIKLGKAIGKGMNILKDLGNAPSNICTPRYLANYAIDLSKKVDDLKVTVLKQEDLESLNMNTLLSVAKGSKQEPRLITMEYRGSKDAPIVLVGKGVTFDSGGISLKPGDKMDEMKYDMCGAGSVIATIYTIAKLGLPVHVIGVIPAVENMPDGNASKPGDIVTSMSGKTIEILNTDAEGRLILCDALTYAEQFDPKVVIDIATLTGAVIIALGKHPTGLLANDDKLAQDLISAGNVSGDRVWQLPLWEEYSETIKSPFADLQNISGSREAGTIIAGCFLSEFTKNYKWAHLDIAATAWGGAGLQKGATGRPVPLLVEYIISQLDVAKAN